MPHQQDNEDTNSITGLIVQSRPEMVSGIEHSLSHIDGVEVHITDPQGKLIVTIEEQAGEKTMINRINQINQVEGVLSTALVYSHHEAWS